jgi:hypothetical protein
MLDMHPVSGWSSEMQEAVRKKNPSTALRRYPALEGAGLRGRTARIKG